MYSTKCSRRKRFLEIFMRQKNNVKNKFYCEKVLILRDMNKSNVFLKSQMYFLMKYL